MSLEKAKASLEANLKKRENSAEEKKIRPSEKHSKGTGVIMSNALIEATHYLNLNERRIIYLAMTRLKGGYDVHINAKEFGESFGMDETNAYRSLESACNKLFEREIRFNDGRKKGRARWVQEAVYHEGEGWASLKFTDVVRTNIKGLQSQYTKYSLEQAGNLKSVYSWRFLERFMQFYDPKKRKGFWQISVEDLCNLLELSEFYLKWPILRQKIILPSAKELEEKDGWKIDILPIKTGRKTTHVRFEFKQNPQGRLDL